MLGDSQTNLFLLSSRPSKPVIAHPPFKTTVPIVFLYWWNVAEDPMTNQESNRFFWKSTTILRVFAKLALIRSSIFPEQYTLPGVVYCGLSLEFYSRLAN